MGGQGPSGGRTEGSRAMIAFAGTGDCVPSRPRSASSEPDRADATGHGGHVSGESGWLGR